jgi:hypothetical protein
MNHDYFVEDISDIPELFDSTYESTNSLFYAYSHAWISYEDELESDDKTESNAAYLILIQHLLNRTDTIHELKKINATETALDVLNNPDRLELEPEDKETLIEIAKDVLDKLERVTTHNDDSRA